jgi:ParB family chromosome partitioning protein
MPEVLENIVIDPALVVVSDRLRDIDRAWVEAIAASIKQKGQDTPIQVRRCADDRLHLVAGAHRHAACLSSGLDIRAEVIACSDLEARLIEIDENLFRRELGALDRAVFMSERQAVYLQLYPDTAQGVAGGKARQGAASDILSFAAETAKRTGFSRRTIERAVKIAHAIPVEIRERLRGTPYADRQVDLDALAGLSPEQQRQVVALITGGGAKTLKAAIAIVDGTTEPESDPDDRQYDALMKCWGNASPAAQSRFLAALRLNGELEG